MENKPLMVRLTPLGAQVGKLLTERPLISSAEQMAIIHKLTPLYKASGRDMCDLFDEYYVVADGHATQVKEITDIDWPDIVGQ